MKNETEVVLRLSSDMIGHLNDETNFPHKLLLTKSIIKMKLYIIEFMQKIIYLIK